MYQEWNERENVRSSTPISSLAYAHFLSVGDTLRLCCATTNIASLRVCMPSILFAQYWHMGLIGNKNTSRCMQLNKWKYKHTQMLCNTDSDNFCSWQANMKAQVEPRAVSPNLRWVIDCTHIKALSEVEFDFVKAFSFHQRIHCCRWLGCTKKGCVESCARFHTSDLVRAHAS